MACCWLAWHMAGALSWSVYAFAVSLAVEKDCTVDPVLKFVFHASTATTQ